MEVERAVLRDPRSFRGRAVERDRTDAESVGLSDDERDILGEQILDIYLNRKVFWSGVPAAAWDYKIGGFQVLRKWLSYREERVLQRALTVGEARTFTHLVRRLTELSDGQLRFIGLTSMAIGAILLAAVYA